jgi:Tol biopolymer transport system component
MDLVWLDRRGVSEPAADRPLAVRALDLSPDARRFAALVEPQETGSLDLWVGEFARGTVIRLTTGINDSLSPRWSPDGKWLAYMNRDSGDDDLYRIRSDGTGVPERLFEGRDLDTYITDWSADGTLLLFDGMEKTGQRRSRIWGLDLATGEARMILEGDRASVSGARLSPDGRWLAHVSDESGQSEVYIRPFPGLDRKWQVSRQGGNFPHWRQDVRELTYIGPAASIFAVPLAPHGDDIGLGSPILLFTPTRLDLAILPSAREAVETISPATDHSRFLASLAPADRAELPLRLILDWAARRPDQGVTSAPSRSR